MKIIAEYIQGLYTFNSLKNQSSGQYITIDSDSIYVNYLDFIDNLWTNDNFRAVKNLNIGLYGKAPCGGFISLLKCSSNEGKAYVIYAGVNEISNSNYIITIHKVLSTD